jgi:crotonobetainyl-CoA:carnitine CoA-transferase CaiB-like acyl-CoA transferase
VVKVEGRGRPDGARRGSSAFFDLLNHDKECLALDFSDAEDVALLRRLIAAADLVVEGSRPRVMEGLGIEPEIVADGGTSWLSITGHGRAGFAGQRVGFGDDTAVAGGLFIDGDPPMFVGDAIADPIAGLVGATVTADLLAADRAAVVELPLARTAAWMSSRPVEAEVARRGDDWYVDTGDGEVLVEPPRARPAAPVAPALGEHDDRLRAEFGAPAEERSGGANR